MRAAIASADYTPAPGAVLQGHYNRNASHSVLTPLQAKAAVFEQDGEHAAILALDLLGVDADSCLRIRDRICQLASGFAHDRILVAGTHTHCAPAAVPCLGMVPDPAFVAAFEAAAVQAASDALERLEPVQLGVGCGSAFIHVNRRPLAGSTAMVPNWGGLMDPRVRVLRLSRPDGTPVGLLAHFSCHPTTLSGALGNISADYPWYARQRAESRLRCPVLFLQGCSGNVRPAIVDETGRSFAAATPEQLRTIGEAVGDAAVVAATAAGAVGKSVLTGCRHEFLLAYGETLPDAQLQALAEGPHEPSPPFLRAWARQVLRLQQAQGLPAGEPTEMQALRVGPLALVSLPGEPVQEIGHAIERSSVLGDGVMDLWPVGYANDLVGYLVTEQIRSEGGYEPAAFPYYERPAAWRAEADQIRDVATALLARL